jgi:hypothetical protein
LPKFRPDLILPLFERRFLDFGPVWGSSWGKKKVPKESRGQDQERIGRIRHGWEKRKGHKPDFLPIPVSKKNQRLPPSLSGKVPFHSPNLQNGPGQDFFRGYG